MEVLEMTNDSLTARHHLSFHDHSDLQPSVLSSDLQRAGDLYSCLEVSLGNSRAMSLLVKFLRMVIFHKMSTRISSLFIVKFGYPSHETFGSRSSKAFLSVSHLPPTRNHTVFQVQVSPRIEMHVLRTWLGVMQLPYHLKKPLRLVNEWAH